MPTGGGSNTNTIEKSSEPWKEQQPYLKEIMAQAQNLYNTSNLSYFPGSTVAAVTPEQRQAQNMTRDLAQNQAVQMQNNALKSSNILANAADVNNNPYLNQAIAAATRPVEQQLTQAGGAFQQGRGDAIGAGQYGGSRQGIYEGITGARGLQTIGDISATMSSDAYNKGLQAVATGLQLTPQTQQAAAFPAQLMEGLGSQLQSEQQANINEAIARHNFDQQAQYMKLQAYQQMVSGNMGSESTSTSTGPGAQGNALAGAMGGAAAGASLMAAVPALATNPAGWAIMAGMALMGGLGSS